MTGQNLWSTTTHNGRAKIYFVVKRDTNRKQDRFVCVTVLPHGTMNSWMDLPETEEDILDREHEEKLLSEMRQRIEAENRIPLEDLCALCRSHRATRFSRKNRQKWCEDCYKANKARSGSCPTIGDWKAQESKKEGVYVVFLDFDGVLNSLPFLMGAKGLSPDERLDPRNVAYVSRLTMIPKVKVVVSSTWRFGKTLEGLKRILRRRGYKGPVDGMTSTGMPNASRWEEIQDWLKEQARIRKVEKFVILDDEGEMGPLQGNLIKTDSRVGLTKEDVDEAIRRLGLSVKSDESLSPPSV